MSVCICGAILAPDTSTCPSSVLHFVCICCWCCIAVALLLVCTHFARSRFIIILSSIFAILYYRRAMCVYVYSLFSHIFFAPFCNLFVSIFRWFTHTMMLGFPCKSALSFLFLPPFVFILVFVPLNLLHSCCRNMQVYVKYFSIFFLKKLLYERNFIFMTFFSLSLSLSIAFFFTSSTPIHAYLLRDVMALCHTIKPATPPPNTRCERKRRMKKAIHFHTYKIDSFILQKGYFNRSYQWYFSACSHQRDPVCRSFIYIYHDAM